MLREPAGSPWAELPRPDPAAFQALRHPFRREIVRRAAAATWAPVASLLELSGGSPERCYYHLATLEKAGLVEVRRGAVRVRPESLIPLREYFDVALALQCVTSNIVRD